MIRKSTAVLLIVALVLLIVWSGWDQLSKLDFARIPTRASWQRPAKVIGALGITKGKRVADVGAGDGYFTFLLADAVGPAGRVYAVEVDSYVAESLEQRAEGRGAANVDVVLGELDDPRLPDGGVDVVFLCNTYHHIERRTDYFARLRADLRPGGQVAVIDMRSDLTGIARLFADPEHWTRREDLLGEMALAGYRHLRSFDFLPMQSFEVFAPAE
jgi:ubiquinone/menaquinone biosynthesis C-methylase UbiE